MRPAMIVVGLAALILVLFVTIGIVSTQSPAPVKHSDAAVAVPGRQPAGRARRRTCSRRSSTAGEPPTNILNAVSVPAGSVRISHQNNSAGAGQFDSQVTFRSDDSQAALLAFYAADMKPQGWQVFDRGAAANDPGALEVLGKLAGSDGYYWEMGATVTPRRSARAARPRASPTSPSGSSRCPTPSRHAARVPRRRNDVSSSRPRHRADVRRVDGKQVGRRGRLGQQVGPDEEVDRVEQVAHPRVRAPAGSARTSRRRRSCRPRPPCAGVCR